ncbi:alpha/beta fold hydrolase [Flagellimonas nanhaiensis]|uniref:Alpha/beta hydrolase n=1 Tax=Flagellimonas nanhaiensis TaxID=2292706 RepID=A0A371JSL1_9FLAO|nr:alpha/beta hydrolase [Allomuricauda nanhaiensis]RDY60802.1 alpha/beta hydrolase [Allomuricauda nanhaiensis]
MRTRKMKGNRLFTVKLFMFAALMFTLTSMGQKVESKTIRLPKLNKEIHYLHKGSGTEKWVLVHGLGSYSQAYAKLLDSLPQGIQAFAIDLPGFGESKIEDFEPGMERYASVLNEFVEQLGLANVTVMGHSMGGQISMKLALKQPKWLKKLVLFAPAGIEQFSDQDKAWFGQVVTESLYLNLTDEQVRQNFDINFFGNKLPKDAEFMFQDRMKIKKDETLYQEYCSTIVSCIQAMLKEPVYSEISKIEVPVLIFYGKQDVLIPNRILHADLSLEQMLNTLKNDYPDVEIKAVDNAGHFIIWDQPIKILEAIRTFSETN